MKDTQNTDAPVEVRSDDIQWNKLEPPKSWKPEPGDEIAGYYLGTSTRDGVYGQYNVVMLAVPDDKGFSRPVMISGIQVIQAIDGSSTKPGAFISVTVSGIELTANGHNMKVMDVYEASGSITFEQAQKYMASIMEEDAN